MKINNMKKSILVILGLAYGIGATSQTKISISDNKKSLIPEINNNFSLLTRKNAISSSLVKRDSYSECVDKYTPAVKRYLEETRVKANEQVISLHKELIKTNTGEEWRDYCNISISACDEIYGNALNENKYSDVKDITWDIETCLKRNLWIGNYCFLDHNECSSNGNLLYNGDGTITFNRAYHNRAESGIFYMPFIVPLLPGLSTLQTMYSKDLSKFEANGKRAWLKYPEFLKECIEPKVESYCKSKENEKNNTKESEKNNTNVNIANVKTGKDTKEDEKNNKGIIFTILGAIIGALLVALTIAGFLFYRHKKDHATKSNNNGDIGQDIDIQFPKDNKEIDIDIKSPKSNCNNEVGIDIKSPKSNCDKEIGIDIQSPKNNCNKEIDIAECCSSDQQTNLGRQENIVVNALVHTIPVEDSPPCYEDIAQCSSNQQNDYNKGIDIVMSKSRDIRPPKVFLPAYKDEKKDINAKQEDKSDNEPPKEFLPVYEDNKKDIKAKQEDKSDNEPPKEFLPVYEDKKKDIKAKQKDNSNNEEEDINIC